VPLSAENFLQESSGTSAASTTFAVTLPSGTTDGSAVVVVISGPAGGSCGATGFTLDKASVAATVGIYSKPGVAAGETSWTFTQGGTQVATWTVYEVSNLDPVVPADGTATNTGTIAPGNTLASGTTPENSGMASVVIAAFSSVSDNNDVTWDSYTDDFEPLSLADPVFNTNNSAYHRHSVARRFVEGTTGQFSTTATVAGTDTTIIGYSAVVVYRAADAPVQAPLTGLAGHEQGTHGGMAQNVLTGGEFLLHNLTSSFFLPTGTWGTHYVVQSGSARNGGYGLRIATSAATCYIPTWWLGSNTGKSGVWGVNLRVVSATGTVTVLEGMDTSGLSTTLFRVVYDSSTNKFGIRHGTAGTVSWQDGTTALNAWVWLDLRAFIAGGMSNLAWRLETAGDTYTDQPAPAATSTGATYFGTIRLGGNVSQTMTVDYDEVLVTKHYGAYPLGPQKVVLLKVDPAGTVTVNGTSSNFSRFINNGTLDAFNAVNFRNALDDVPPTISASADGVVQTAVAATDYIEFPMETYTLAADEVITDVRLVVPLWGGTGTGTGTLGFRGWDGTTETVLVPATTSYDADSLTAVSSIYPLWATKVWHPTGGWTQAKLDAACVRMGFSTDATPDMGAHAIYLEVAIGKAKPEVLFGEPGGLYVEAHRHPVTNALAGFTVYTPADRGCTVNYEINGVAQTPVVVAASGTEYVPTDGDTFVTVNRLEGTPEG
jgi:hypothetical protein